MSRSRSLFQVQLVDLDIGEQSQRLRVIEASLGETDELREVRRAFLEAEDKLLSLRKSLRRQEVDLDDLMKKVEGEEARLYSGEIKNPKELSGIQEEVWSLKRRCEEMEEGILDTMLGVDDAEQTLAVLSARRQEVEERWAEAQARFQEERQALRTRLTGLSRQREELKALIPDEDLSVYEELRAKKGGQAVAILESGICRGCGVGLPVTQARQAQQGQILTLCDNCGRILHPGG